MARSVTPLFVHVSPEVKALVVELAAERGVSQGTIAREILDAWYAARAAARGETIRPVAEAAQAPPEAPTLVRPVGPRPAVTRDALQPAEEARR